MYVKAINKKPQEAAHASFKFLNKNPDIIYNIQRILVVDVIDKNGIDHDSTMIDLEKSYCLDDTVYLWVQGGDSNNLYDLSVYVQTTEGEVRSAGAKILII